jgi:hypothetical protein
VHKATLTKYQRLQVGMAMSQQAATRKWTPAEQDQVDWAIRHVARMLPEFTADDVWARLGRSFPVNKGMAARLNAAARAGLIRNTGRLTVADRGGTHDHAQRLTIWEAA